MIPAHRAPRLPALLSVMPLLFALLTPSLALPATSESFHLTGVMNASADSVSSSGFSLIFSLGGSQPYGQCGQPGIGSYVVWSGFCGIGRHPRTDVHQPQEVLSVPTEYKLRQNYPNPFNPETEILFEIPYRSEVLLRVFDIEGRLVRTIADAHFPAGYHSVTWDGRNQSGALVASGVYFCHLDVPDFQAMRKMLLLE